MKRMKLEDYAFEIAYKEIVPHSLINQPYIELDDSPLDIDVTVHTVVMDEIVSIGQIRIGNIRTNDKLGTEGENDLTVWYQDGTKWTINYSWFL